MRSRAAAALLALALIGPAAGGELADPTRPALPPRHRRPSQEPADAALVLQSVLLSPDHRVAVINGRRVQIGDRVSGARVVDIELSGVRLLREDGEVLLSLTGTVLNKSPAGSRSSR